MCEVVIVRGTRQLERRHRLRSQKSELCFFKRKSCSSCWWRGGCPVRDEEELHFITESKELVLDFLRTSEHAADDEST